MEQPPEIDLLQSSLVMKDHEIFNLRTELDRRIHEFQMLVHSIERMEKTMAACYDRVARKVDRLSMGTEGEFRKRKRR